MAKVVLKLLETASGQATRFDNGYVAEYDPAYAPPGLPYDGGLLSVTDDIGQAMQFPNAATALEKWREPFGIRTDGEQNRPLTAWSIEIVPIEDSS
jgi:hypothetical protein